jgi:hypothetical protein
VVTNSCGPWPELKSCAPPSFGRGAGACEALCVEAGGRGAAGSQEVSVSMSRLIAFLPRFTAGAALTVALMLAPTVFPSGGDKVEARTKNPAVRDHRTPPKWTPKLAQEG